MRDFLNIGLAGDVMLGRTLDLILARNDYDFPWGNVLPLLRENDFNIINLETALTYSSNRVNKTFNFKTSPDNVKSLLSANVTVANLANNHVLDFGEEGLLETLSTLDKAGIRHVGAGKNIGDALAPIILRKNNIVLGVLGVTDNEPGWLAGSSPGVNYINVSVQRERAIILRAIESLKKQCEILIVSIHWGPNMREKPAREFISFAHEMVDYGANVIHGHSAHILQGIERYKNNLILYDTGDFIDDYVIDPELRNDLSALFILQAYKSSIGKIKLHPVRIAEYQVNLAMGEDYDWVINRVGHLSSAFDTKLDEKAEIVLDAKVSTRPCLLVD